MGLLSSKLKVIIKTNKFIIRKLDFYLRIPKVYLISICEMKFAVQELTLDEMLEF